MTGASGGRPSETRVAGGSSLHREDDGLPAQKPSDREAIRESTGLSEDAELVRRASAGDGSAFEALVLRYETPLRKLVYGYVLNWQVAEDVAQDAFPAGLPEARRPGRVGRVQELALPDRDQTGRTTSCAARRAGAGGWTGTWGRRPSRVACRWRGVGSRVAAAPARPCARAGTGCRRDQRTAVVLKDVAGMKYVEIAELLGCPIGTAQIRVHRGRQKLRRRLDEPGKAGGRRGGTR